MLTGVLGLTAFTSPAFAQADERNGDFSCRASLLKLQQAGEDPALEPVIANEQGSPCADDDAGLLAREILPPDAAADEPHGDLGVLYAKTDARDDDPLTPAADEHAAHAESGVAFVLLTDGENTLIAQVITAEADGRCVDGRPQLSGRSAVVSLTILQPGEEPTVLALPPDNERFTLPDTATDDPNDEMALHLNETIEEDTNDDGTNDKLTQRAVWLEAEQGDIILGEAVADFSGNPCERAPEQGRIVIVKDTEPEDDQDFTFNGTVDDDGTFQLDDDGNDAGAGPETAGDDDLPNSAAFDRPPGPYNLTEEEVEGFELEDIDCDDENSEENEETRSVVINLEDGETVTCTFKNVKDVEEEGRVTVVKDTQPDDPQDFAFELDCDDSEGEEEDDEDGDDHGEDCDQEFLLDDDDEHPAGDNTLPDRRTFTVPAGKVEIEEEGNAEDGFDLESITCEPAQDGERQEIEEDGEGGEVEFNLEDGEEVTCTFKNVREDDDNDTVTVVKDTDPDDPQDFNFEIDRTQGQGGFDQEFVLDDDGENGSATPNMRVFTPGNGRVRIEERGTDEDGFDLESITCTPDQSADEDFRSEIDEDGDRGSVEFILDPGEDVTCTFKNVPGDDEDVPECRDGDDNDDDGKVDHPADPGCADPDDDDERDEVDPQPGQGTIEIRKGIVNTDPDGAPPFQFEGTDPIGEFSLSHNEEREFNVPAGQYSVTELEDENDGFRLWRIECDDEAGDETQGPAHGGDNTARIDLDAGEDITCSFYNARDDDPDPGNSGPGNANSDGDSDDNSGPGLRSRSAGLPLLDPVLGLLR